MCALGQGPSYLGASFSIDTKKSWTQCFLSPCNQKRSDSGSLLDEWSQTQASGAAAIRPTLTPAGWLPDASLVPAPSGRAPESRGLSASQLPAVTPAS